MADYLQFLGSMDQNPAPFLLPEQTATPEPMLMPGQVPVKHTFGMPILSEEEFLAMKKAEEERLLQEKLFQEQERQKRESERTFEPDLTPKSTLNPQIDPLTRLVDESKNSAIPSDERELLSQQTVSRIEKEDQQRKQMDIDLQKAKELGQQQSQADIYNAAQEKSKAAKATRNEYFQYLYNNVPIENLSRIGGFQEWVKNTPYAELGTPKYLTGETATQTRPLSIDEWIKTVKYGEDKENVLSGTVGHLMNTSREAMQRVIQPIVETGNIINTQIRGGGTPGAPMYGFNGQTQENIADFNLVDTEQNLQNSENLLKAKAFEQEKLRNPKAFESQIKAPFLPSEPMKLSDAEISALEEDKKTFGDELLNGLDVAKTIALAPAKGIASPWTGSEVDEEVATIAYELVASTPALAAGSLAAGALGSFAAAEMTGAAIIAARRIKTIQRALKGVKSSKELARLKEAWEMNREILRKVALSQRGKAAAKFIGKVASKDIAEATTEQIQASFQGQTDALTPRNVGKNLAQETTSFGPFKYPSVFKEFVNLLRSEGGLSSAQADRAINAIMASRPEEYAEIAKSPKAKEILTAISKQIQKEKPTFEQKPVQVGEANVKDEKGKVVIGKYRTDSPNTPSYDLRLDTQAVTGKGLTTEEKEQINNQYENEDGASSTLFTEPPAEGYSGMNDRTVYSVPGYFTPGNENAKDIRANLPRKTLFFDADANTVQEETFHGAMSQIRKENPTLMNRAESAAENMRTQFTTLMDSYRKGEVTDPEARGKIQTLARALETTPEKLKEANLGGEELIHAVLFPKYRANEAEQALGKLFGLPNQLREDLLSALGKPLAKMSVGAKKAIIRGEEGITTSKQSMNGQKNSIIAYHGTGNSDVTNLDYKKENLKNARVKGTGEGFNAFGPGIYLSQSKNVAKGYHKAYTKEEKEITEQARILKEKEEKTLKKADEKSGAKGVDEAITQFMDKASERKILALGTQEEYAEFKSKNDEIEQIEKKLYSNGAYEKDLTAGANLIDLQQILDGTSDMPPDVKEYIREDMSSRLGIDKNTSIENLVSIAKDRQDILEESSLWNEITDQIKRKNDLETFVENIQSRHEKTTGMKSGSLLTTEANLTPANTLVWDKPVKEWNLGAREKLSNLISSEKWSPTWTPLLDMTGEDLYNEFGHRVGSSREEWQKGDTSVNELFQKYGFRGTSIPSRGAREGRNAVRNYVVWDGSDIKTLRKERIGKEGGIKEKLAEPSKEVSRRYFSITPAQDKVITHIQSLLNKNGIRPPKGDISHFVDELSKQGRPQAKDTYAEQQKELKRAEGAKRRYVDFIAAVDRYLDESDSRPELLETGFGGGTGTFSADDLISKINEWTARGADVRESSTEDYSPKTLLTEGWTSNEQGPEMTKMEAWDTPSEVYVAGMKLTSEVRKGKIVFKDENGKPVITMNPDETVFIDTDAPTPVTNNDRDLDILDLKADARKARETEQKEKAKAKKETEDKKKEQAEIAAIERSQERIRQEHKAKQEAEDKRNKSFDKAEIGKERDTSKDTEAGKQNTKETRKVIPPNIAEDEFNREIQERMAAEAQFKKEWLEKRSETQQAEFKQAIKEIDENAPAPAWQPSHTKIGNRLGMSAHRLNRALSDIHASIYEMEKLLPNKLLQSGYSEYRRLPAITSNVIEKKIAPLTKAIEDLLRKEGIKFEDASEYAYAVHALNINSFRKSGITDKEAELIKERVIAGSKKRESALERMVNTLIPAINDVKMDALVEAGVYTREQVNAWKEKYKLYVPLKTDEQGVVSFEYETLSDLVYMINKNLGNKMMEGKKSGDAFKTSLANKQTVSSTGVRTPPVGRSLKADSPLAFAVRDAVNGIIKAEQVKAQSVVLDWIKANQDPGWITVSKPQFKDWSENEKGIWEPNWRTADGQFSKGFGDNTEKGTAVILQNGAYYQIQANPNNAFAMSTLHSIVADDLYKMWEITKLASAVNNYRSTVLTRINPLFAATNTPKDFQQMVTKTFIRHGLKASAFTLLKFPGAVGVSAVKKAGFLFPKILEDFANGKVNKDYSFERWVELGGPTSYMKPNTIQDIATSMQQAVDGGFQLGKVKEYVFNTLSFVNEVLETAIRISTYRAVMAVMPKGLSLEQQEAYEKNAVLFSREVSVDFNMKGYASPFFNMYHMFFNPGAQSVRSMTQDFMIDKQTTRRAVAVYTAATLFGMGLTIYNRMMGGNDDDTEENLWDTIDSSKKATNILISLGKKGGYYVIPLLFGGPGIAVILGQTIMGMNDYFLEEGTNRDNFYESQFMASMTNAALASVDPLGVGFENPAQALVPSFLTPIWELKTNKNNIGMDIVPDKGSSSYTRPESGKYYAKTPQYMKDIAAKWNELNGGSKYQSSGLYSNGKEKPLGFARDVSPEIFMYGSSYIGGGLFTLANNLRVMHQTPAEEAPEKVDRLAVNAFTKRWFYKPKDQVARMNVYDNLNNLAILKAKLGDIGKLSGKQASRDYATEIAPELMYYSSYIGMAKADKFWNSAEETDAYQWSKKFMDSKEEDSEETVARRKAIEKLYRPYFKKSLEYKKAYAQGDIDKVLELKVELKIMLKNAGKPTEE